MNDLSRLGSGLRNTSVRVLIHDDRSHPGQASVTVAFSDGSRLSASYWRLIDQGRAGLSSFDHGQRYGLPEPIDAKKALRKALDDRNCVDASLNAETGDLLFVLDGDIRLQVFNFSGYEVWDFTSPDGSTVYSKHALQPD